MEPLTREVQLDDHDATHGVLAEDRCSDPSSTQSSRQRAARTFEY